jgi:YesN/AraC family two-component response regulator
MVTLSGCHLITKKSEHSEQELLQSYQEMQDSLAQEFAEAYRALEASVKEGSFVSPNDHETAFAQMKSAPSNQPTTSEKGSRVSIKTSSTKTETVELEKMLFVGTKEELIDRAVLDDEGEVVLHLETRKGEGRSKVVDPSRFRFLALDSKQVSLLSEHPVNTYLLSLIGPERTRLEILDEHAFWQKSNYLVIVLN